MKILHIIRSVDPKGGGPIEGIKKFAAVHETNGITVEVATLDGPDDPGVAEFNLPLFPLGPGLGKYGYSSKLVPWLRFHAAGYQAVIINGIWQYASFGTWRALRPMRQPYFLFTHGMMDPWFKHHYPLKHLKKWLYWPWGEYRVLRDARAVLFTAEEERILARQSFWLYRCQERVVGYGTAAPTGDPHDQKECFLKAFPQLQKRRLVLFLGRIHEKKGCDILIKAFARFKEQNPDLHLVFAGPDQVGWQARLRQVAAQLGVSDRITWPGSIFGDLKWGAFHASEVFVLPSHQENFGIAVAEAMACGLPVLISNKVNIWREVVADRAGLVEDDSLSGTVQLLNRWLALSDKERAAMRDNALHCFKSRFEINMAANSLIRILREYGVKDS